MLEIRPNCEHCGQDLPYDSTEAMICSFECTYCKTCALEVFNNVCPSCNGNFVERPIRPKKHLKSNPASSVKVYAPKDINKLMETIEFFKNIPPNKR
ncbi:DUF1272 domain-containing protein [Tenacibaculum xiamenense]|uniref:DUF1272 domain-containing protein n=1 Tax=Tenacibaculum xiamenense TaxID=1261553 RepID=UPI003896684C